MLGIAISIAIQRRQIKYPINKKGDGIVYRDFSDRAQNELLGLVSEVENEKLSNFTDWVGDRWYDFESWIGKLNIKNYINSVNEYHKKVIDKNNATKSSIDAIFKKVKSVDTSYKSTLAGKRSQLLQWQRYIDEMSQIVNPRNGKFNDDYISKSLNQIISDLQGDTIENIKTYFYNIWNGGKGVKELFKFLTGRATPTSGFTTGYVLNVLMNNLSDTQFTGDYIKTGLNFVSKINKALGEYSKNDKISLSSSILSYLSTLAGIANSKSSSGLDITSDILSLFKSSIKVENGIYKYYEKTLHPYEVSKLDAKFGRTMIGLSITSDIAGIANSVIDTYKVFVDPDSSAYDKAAVTIKASDPFLNLGKNVYIASQASQKSLRFVSGVGGSSKAVNQILATEQKLKYTTSAAVTQKIKNVSAGFTIGSAVVSGISSGVKQYGEVTEDGKFDMGDAGSVGMNFAVSGLDSMVNSVTFGLVDFDAEKAADNLESDADEFVRGDSWAAQYIRNQDNNAVLRFGVSIGAGAYVLGENVVEGVADGAKTIGSWVSTGWNTLTNLF